MTPMVTREALLKRIIPALVLTSVEAFVAIVCVISGLPILVRPELLAPNPAIALFPGWTIYLWAVGLVVGGTLALTGIVFSEYRLERIGVLALTSTVGSFSFALFDDLPESFVTLLIFLLFTLAMAARYWTLGKMIKIQQLRIEYLREQSGGSRT